MSISSRLTYNINSLNDIDIINKNYTFKQNNENINKDILCQSQNDNFKISILNRTTPLPYDQIYSTDINNISYNENRFNLLHSRLDEINDKINKEKMEKENLIHSKITTTEMLLDNNNENRERKIKEIKTSIRGLSLLFEQIKQYTKEKNIQRKEILESFENKFDLRLKEEQEKRNNLEKRLKSMIDSKFRDMKSKLNNNIKERNNEMENLKSKMDIKVPQLQAIVDDEKKIRKIKDEEIKEKIKNKMNYYNNMMRNEIKNREIFDEKCLDEIKYTFTEFNKQMRQNTFNREQSQGQLIDLIDATISQIEATDN